MCKNNVAGDDCDSCKPFTFNLQMKNPLGCQSCDCNANGTLGSIKTCHATIGQCECKSHVIGRQCGRCKEGYHSFKGSDVFGCKREFTSLRAIFSNNTIIIMIMMMIITFILWGLQVTLGISHIVYKSRI